MLNKENNIFWLIVSSIICLLPIILSLVVYDNLPEQMVKQWDLQGNPTSYAHKSINAFGFPIFCFIINLVVRLGILSDPKRRNHSKIIQTVAFWIIPLISIIFTPMMIYSALEDKAPDGSLILLIIGIIWIFIGNYFSKIRQNYTMGIKLPWTLHDADNWNKTHKLAGYIMVLCGLLFIFMAITPLSHTNQIILILLIVFSMTVVPIVYSYSQYVKSQKKESDQ